MVSEVLGHASITITKDVYGHLMEGDKRAAAESMSQALFGLTNMPWLPAWLPWARKRPLPIRVGASGLARSEGLEPPTF